MNIYLLTHEKELRKSTNTGQIVLDTIGDIAKRVVWQRTNPDPTLEALLTSGCAALIYPSENDQCSPSVDEFEYFVLLDGTWQESRKMYNRSAYLKTASTIGLDVTEPSGYRLRRNQVHGGVCTAEAVIALLQSKKQFGLADKVNDAFVRFNQ